MSPKALRKTPYSVKRYKGDIYDEVTGLTRSRESDKFPARGSIQPLSGHEILQLPEGDREKKHLWVYTEFELKIDDVITHKSQEFETRFVECWDDSDKFPYFLARVEMIDVERN